MRPPDARPVGAPLRVGLIGFGAIGRTLWRLLAAQPQAMVCTGVLVRAGSGPATRSPSAAPSPSAPDADPPRFADLAALIAAGTDVIVECAGHAALREHGPRVLAAGVDLLVASVGALADPSLEAALREASARGGGRVRVPSGALGGLDALRAARLAGLEAVEYRSTKAPSAWRGTAAETLVDLDALREATVFLETDARDAALRFPQNANVAAAVALAGLGFERTRVRLEADPAARGNRHTIRAHGAFGLIEIVVEGRTLPDNPKTSVLAPHSLAAALFEARAAIGAA